MFLWVEQPRNCSKQAEQTVMQVARHKISDERASSEGVFFYCFVYARKMELPGASLAGYEEVALHQTTREKVSSRNIEEYS